jgi:hypothetical protein
VAGGLSPEHALASIAIKTTPQIAPKAPLFLVKLIIIHNHATPYSMGHKQYNSK